MQHKAASISIAKPKKSSLELTENIIHVRAYRFFEERGCEHGHDLEDWLRAKAEIFGRKPAAVAEVKDAEGWSIAAAA